MLCSLYAIGLNCQNEASQSGQQADLDRPTAKLIKLPFLKKTQSLPRLSFAQRPRLRFFNLMLKPFKICVLISGGGTTLKNLLEHYDSGRLEPQITHVISNNTNAGGLQHAERAGIDSNVIDHRDFDSEREFSEAIFESIRLAGADLVVMGGFLRRLQIPDDFINKIINIHPSLIPSFCGKGNYGKRVHQAVIDYGCKVTGCTVHFVDEHYDHGPIIAQSTVEVKTSDNAQVLAARVFEAECELYPQVINALAQGKISVNDRTVKWI
jgi:phosphoribosylglycinamide formyltransferase-1